MIKRAITSEVRKLAKEFPAIAILGPRQSGKTTLAKKLFPKYKYISFEDHDVRAFAKEDPRGFLEKYNSKTIFDEIQKAPELISYLQSLIDEKNQVGDFILTGSQNYLLMENVSQSLAGRIGIVNLLPLTTQEISQVSNNSLEKQIITGGYPRIYDQNIRPNSFYKNYINTYLEKDVRLITNIKNYNFFTAFIKLIAGRSGQELKTKSIAEDLGVAEETVKSWINILETSFIVFKLKPYHKNYNKRLIKTPKLYFYDTGLLCYLLGIKTEEEFTNHYYKGAIFETYIVSEFVKNNFNYAEPLSFFFWRDNNFNEIDLIIEKAGKAFGIEIKAGKTLSLSFYKNLKYWQNITGVESKNCMLIYGGKENRTFKKMPTYGWQNIWKIFSNIIKSN